MVAKYYPGLSAADADQVANCAATRILRLPDINRDPQTTAFVPQNVENYRPSPPLAISPRSDSIRNPNSWVEL